MTKAWVKFCDEDKRIDCCFCPPPRDKTRLLKIHINGEIKINIWLCLWCGQNFMSSAEMDKLLAMSEEKRKEVSWLIDKAIEDNMEKRENGEEVK